MKVSERLKEARELAGKTQTQVSKDTGVNNKTLSGYERDVSEPDLATINLLADYYKVSADYLLGRTDIKNPYENEIETIAAHHDGDRWTDEELDDIEKFKEFVKMRREQRKKE